MSLVNQYRLPIMGFAALWILFFHTGVFVLQEETIFYWIFFFIRRIGYLGVDIFFILSGIGMVYSYEKAENVWVFWGHRAKRIVLPMLIMAVLYMLTEPWSLKEFLENITGYHYYMIGIERSFLWYYFAAVTFYLFFPLYYLGFKKSKNKWVYFALVFCIWLAVSLGAWALFREEYHKLPNHLIRATDYPNGLAREDFYKMTNRIPVFLAGVQMGWLLYNKKKISFTRTVWIVLAGIMAVGLYMEYLADFKSVLILLPYSDCGVPAWLVSIPLTMILTKVFTKLKKCKGTAGEGSLKILGFYGVISYELYCVQEWIFNILVKDLLSPGIIGVFMLDLMVFSFSTMFGWLLYRINRRFWQKCQRTGRTKSER